MNLGGMNLGGVDCGPVFALFLFCIVFFSGSLMSRNLSELVKKEDVVQESEYLVTLLVVISRLVN